ncbi:MAG TPA: hypothetical protein PLT66_08685, partial [Bacillota bacterium]|nr:hypothetical protein [Bacillota bacterium]
LTDAYSAVTGDVNTTYTTGGGTYARAFPNTVAFGNSMADSSGLLGERRGDPHDRDEYITIREMHDGIRIIVRALLNLSKVN